ncbi:arylsulfatase [Rubritalea spongiae]|uniref:Arylsulfatase n=1 Tax=Rubritalea spongiae TaxID=430797 RepID=A0ABW5DXL4_9BACT
MKLLICFIIYLSLCHFAQCAQKPNILIIMADDMGYSDIACFGGEIETPNIDTLAAAGMRFGNFYTDAKCGPSRAAMMTGQFSHLGRLRVGATFAEILKPLNYRTLMTGKWHQGPKPTDYGFDRYYGLVDGCCNFWNPGLEARPGEGKPGRKKQMGDKARIWGIEDQLIETGYTPKDKNFYTTDAFTDYAVERLEEYKNEENPFLLYVAYTAPHYPLHAWPEDIAKYKDTYTVGWDAIRNSRYQRMLEMGIINEKFKLSPRDNEVDAWDELTAEEQQKQAKLMAVYAAMIDRMDQGIGKIINKLKETGQYENTMIIFMSDNGACAEPPNTDPNIPPGPVEGYRSVGKGWANASSTPFRLYKATSHEGGTRAPMILSWPGVTKPGSFSDHVCHLIDFVPTFMEITGATYPTEIRGRKLKKTNGISILPTLNGEEQKQHPYLAWERGGSKAIRIGDWKLVSQKSKSKNTPWELYNLADDPVELNDLASQHPEKLKTMEKKWLQWMQLKE